ncbi:MAG: hypothetical protein KKG33_04470 [candidate division Zixibacteria bacterium]|nr:hypothetical protein [candidate division Zixibacteria bacterium]MBU1470295.1 hypothetical protein [candidate division Zixibacteria bacterium]MBU2624796.1 hypothetical protein [candidate division Zixibacteria bacterium]
MNYELDRKEILKKNPAIDKELVEKALSLVDQAEKMGVPPVGNKYVPPFRHTIFDQIRKKEKGLDK